MTEEPTRAKKMADSYGQKLEQLDETSPKVRKIIREDKQTLEQKEQLRKAKEKLRDFIDLIR